MPVASTSKLANRNVHRDMWYDRIARVMKNSPRNAFCIADIAKLMNAEKSTISARLNEMVTLEIIQYAGTQRSESTGVMSKHYQLVTTDTLF